MVLMDTAGKNTGCDANRFFCLQGLCNPQQQQLLEYATDDKYESAIPGLAGEEFASFPAQQEPLRFHFLLTRPTVSSSWGMSLAVESESALTVLSVKPGSVVAVANENATDEDHTLRAGCVITELGSAVSSQAMVEKLQSEMSITAMIVRHLSFTARLVRKSKSEKMAAFLENQNGVLTISSIKPVDSPISRWNQENCEMPIVVSDMIVFVNGKETEQDIVAELRGALEMVLFVRRIP